MFEFTNIHDVQQKFLGTIVMFQKKAHSVAHVGVSPLTVDGERKLQLSLTSDYNTPMLGVMLDDSNLNYTDFNLGYANSLKSPIALWWCRRPSKQFFQGLDRKQVVCRTSCPINDYVEPFALNRSISDMLEGIYPSIEKTRQRLLDRQALSCAFNRDFALIYDPLRNTFLLEYRGNRVGTCSTSSLTDFSLYSDYKYLTEALEEALEIAR